MRTLHVLCAILGLIGHAVASTPPLDITEYAHTSFTPAQGAPTVVEVLAQTSDGFLWLGTVAGLYRFDGVRFERIESVGGIPLLGETITALHAPPTGGLWIGYQLGGVSFFDGRGLKNYPPGNGGMPDGTIEAIAIDSNGVVWAGSTRGLARFTNERWTNVTETVGLPSPNAAGLMADKSGNLWIESGGKLALLRRGSSKVHVYALPVLASLRRDPDGRIWNMVDNPNCLYLLDPTRDDAPPCRHVAREFTDFWLIDRAGNVWAEDAENRLRVLPTALFGHEPPARAAERTSVPDPRYLSFADRAQPISELEDREGNIWFGTYRRSGTAASATPEKAWHA
jgi:hypothetical protein